MIEKKKDFSFIEEIYLNYCPSVIDITLCWREMTRRFIVMTYAFVQSLFSFPNVNLHYSQMFRYEKRTMMMNNCSWQNKRRRPSVDGAQDCIWPQLFSLSVHRSQDNKQKHEKWIEKKKKGELDLCLSALFKRKDEYIRK